MDTAGNFILGLFFMYQAAENIYFYEFLICGFEVLMPLVMRSSGFRDVMPSSLLR
jgi:hypothetical protein